MNTDLQIESEFCKNVAILLTRANMTLHGMTQSTSCCHTAIILEIPNTFLLCLPLVRVPGVQLRENKNSKKAIQAIKGAAGGSEGLSLEVNLLRGFASDEA